MLFVVVDWVFYYVVGYCFGSCDYVLVDSCELDGDLLCFVVVYIGGDFYVLGFFFLFEI